MASSERQYTRAEVEQQRAGGGGGDKQTVFIIDNEVYDVTPFLDEHPGGHEVLQAAGGGDASEDFADVGHSMDAKQLMAKWRVGRLVEADRVPVSARRVAWDDSRADEDASFVSSWKFPVLLGVLATVLYSYLFG